MFLYVRAQVFARFSVMVIQFLYIYNVCVAAYFRVLSTCHTSYFVIQSTLYIVFYSKNSYTFSIYYQETSLEKMSFQRIRSMNVWVLEAPLLTWQVLYGNSILHSSIDFDLDSYPTDPSLIFICLLTYEYPKNLLEITDELKAVVLLWRNGL